jgi:RNA polymerase sigma-70 factor (ECF subfamily)
MDESRAIELCIKHRDPIGFEFLVNKYKREAFYHARSLLGNVEDAADACQESFARAFAAIPRLVALDHFYPWFYRILRNCCLNMIRRRKTVAKHRRETRRDVREDAGVASPSDVMEKKEETRQVWAVLDRLRPDFREILVMKYIQDKRYDEISHILGIPRGTVMSRLYHARKAFRDMYVEADGSREEVSR